MDGHLAKIFWLKYNEFLPTHEIRYGKCIVILNPKKKVKYIIIDWTKLFIYVYVLAYMSEINAELVSLGSFDLIRNK